MFTRRFLTTSPTAFCLVCISPMSNLPAPLRRTSPSSQSTSSVSVPTPSDQSNASPSAPASNVVQLNPQPHTEQDQSSAESTESRKEPRKCFICLSEEGEESSIADGETSRWSKPCACSLDSHEGCLIVYVNRQRRDDATKVVRSLHPLTLATHLPPLYPISVSGKATDKM